MDEFNLIKTPEQLLNFMSDFKYKWMDKNGAFHDELNEEIYENYSLMSPEEVIKNKSGICMDQVQLEKYWFEKNKYSFKAITIQVFRNDSSPGHAFIMYENRKKWYWFENAWFAMKGIHCFKNKQQCLDFILECFKKQNDILDYEEIVIEELFNYPYHSSYEEMDKIKNDIKHRL